MIYYEGRGFTTILKNIKSKPLTEFFLGLPVFVTPFPPFLLVFRY